MAGLLAGVNVLESAVLLTGDYLGMLLADEGAEVTKLEHPLIGDYIRYQLGQIAPSYSPYHLLVNRNKKSLTLDMRTPEAREIFARLLAQTDVFITGNIADTPARLGMDYETLRRMKPDIVYCQATGYGAEGPYARIPTHGQMMNALAGGPPLELGSDGRVRARGGGDPAPGAGSGVAIGPLFAAFAIASALLRRERSGEGCYIDISCADSVLATSWVTSLAVLNRERLGGHVRTGSGFEAMLAVSAKYQFYRTKDGKYLLFCALESKFWDHFCEVAGRDDLRARHDRTVQMDFGNDSSLRAELQAIFHTRTQQEWMALFAERDVPVGPALDFSEVHEDPHLAARGMLIDEKHPVAGAFRTLGNPIRVRGQSFAIRVPAPALGEHTDEVLATLGYSAQDIAGLRKRGVV